jgi:nucleoside-diphosphate-sugar epimerase
MARRALDDLGGAHASRKVVAVSRFSDRAARRQLESWGVETIAADLLDRRAVAALPDAPLVVYMAGLKFGTADAPTRMWATNTVAPLLAAERYARSRIVAFSTGNVYPRTAAPGRGAGEDHPLTPVGEYANACVARERVLEWACERSATPLALVRLSYAVNLRYGVLVDIAQKVLAGVPVDLTMGYFNVLWQGDACAWAIRCLEHAASPAFVLNATGAETVSVRETAQRFGELLGRPPVLVGTEAETALLSNASRAHALFGPPTVSLDQMIAWVAHWLRSGGRTLGKPTHFEVRDGRY